MHRNSSAGASNQNHFSAASVPYGPRPVPVHHDLDSSNVLNMSHTARKQIACDGSQPLTDLVLLQRQPQLHAVTGLQFLVCLAFSCCS